uniref:Uncharacterized protein n=1 Tax=Anguilla anguilla TaxID=7936 RepID=A0A0E9R8H0_ANGAN
MTLKVSSRGDHSLGQPGSQTEIPLLPAKRTRAENCPIF